MTLIRHGLGEVAVGEARGLLGVLNTIVRCCLVGEVSLGRLRLVIADVRLDGEDWLRTPVSMSVRERDRGSGDESALLAMLETAAELQRPLQRACSKVPPCMQVQVTVCLHPGSWEQPHMSPNRGASLGSQRVYREPRGSRFCYQPRIIEPQVRLSETTSTNH